MAENQPATMPTGDEITVAAQSDEAQKLLAKAFGELKRAVSTTSAAGDTLFFPNGIEVISLTIKVARYFEITFKVAGEKGVSGLVEGSNAGPGVFARVLSPERNEATSS